MQASLLSSLARSCIHERWIFLLLFRWRSILGFLRTSLILSERKTTRTRFRRRIMPFCPLDQRFIKPWTKKSVPRDRKEEARRERQGWTKATSSPVLVRDVSRENWDRWDARRVPWRHAKVSRSRFRADRESIPSDFAKCLRSRLFLRRPDGGNERREEHVLDEASEPRIPIGITSIETNHGFEMDQGGWWILGKRWTRTSLRYRGGT